MCSSQSRHSLELESLQTIGLICKNPGSFLQFLELIVLLCFHFFFSSLSLFRLPRLPRTALGGSFNSINKAMVFTKWFTLISSVPLFFTPIIEGVSAVLTVPGSDTMYAADALMTASYSLWSLDVLISSFSFGIIEGRVVWVLRKYLAEDAGRKSNSSRDVRAALAQV